MNFGRFWRHSRKQLSFNKWLSMLLQRFNAVLFHDSFTDEDVDFGNPTHQ